MADSVPLRQNLIYAEIEAAAIREGRGRWMKCKRCFGTGQIAFKECGTCAGLGGFWELQPDLYRRDR